jgi:hypothetical protein
MKKANITEGDEMRAEYRQEDLGRGVRGKHFAAYQQGSNLVLLDPDVAKAFPTSEAVNEALRGLPRLTEQPAKLTHRSKKRGA